MPPAPAAILDLPQVVAPLLAMGPVGIIAALGWIMYYRADQKLTRKEREARVLMDKYIALAVKQGEMTEQLRTTAALLENKR